MGVTYCILGGVGTTSILPPGKWEEVTPLMYSLRSSYTEVRFSCSIPPYLNVSLSFLPRSVPVTQKSGTCVTHGSDTCGYRDDFTTDYKPPTESYREQSVWKPGPDKKLLCRVW